MPPLKNLRHEQFCIEYTRDLKDPNASRAYRAAGYKPTNDNSCGAMASALLKRPKVAERIKELTAKMTERLTFNRERVLNELARIAFSDVRKLFDANGHLKNPEEWDDDAAAAVAGVESEKLFERGDHGEKVHIGYTTKVKLWDKNSALTTLSKHFKILHDGPATNINVEAGANITIQVQTAGQLAQQRILKLVGRGTTSNGNGHLITNGHADGAEPGGAAGQSGAA